jgi:hypothetical protein
MVEINQVNPFERLVADLSGELQHYASTVFRVGMQQGIDAAQIALVDHLVPLLGKQHEMVGVDCIDS